MDKSFNIRPSTSGSGIGGIGAIFGDKTGGGRNTDMNVTSYANATSPMKLERGIGLKGINKKDKIESPGIFHPQVITEQPSLDRR